MESPILRRCIAALAAAATLTVSGCGIKGPLRLPPKAPADAAPAATQPSPPPVQQDRIERPSTETPVPELPHVEGPKE